MRRFNKIFGIGLSRTGTHSLTEALRCLGLSAVHFPATLADVEAHDASTDSRVADKFELLDAGFPGSLFILTTREIEGWLSSCELFWASFHQFRYSDDMRAFHERLYGSADFDRQTYAAAHARYLLRVAGHFQHRGRDLLDMNICAGEGWARLTEFLDTTSPRRPFPHDRAPGPSPLSQPRGVLRSS